jgi:putative DNA primase/helicase
MLSKGDFPSDPPAWMAALRIWLLWKLVKQADKLKPKKKPYYVDGTVRNGILGSEKDRSKLVTYADAVAALRKGGRRYAGIGFAVLDGDEIIGFDFDKCLAPDGSLLRHEEPVRRAEALGAYIEQTPSGVGLHIIGGYPADSPPINFNHSATDGIEVYTHKRFFTFTGKRWGTCGEGDADLQELLAMSPAAGSAAHHSSNTSLLLETDNNIERVESALSYCTMARGYSNYDPWRNTVWAIRSLGWDRGREIALAWSQEIAGGWNGEDGFNTIWNSKERADGDGPVRTVASLFYEARQHGWVDPLRPTFIAAEGELGLARVFAERHAGRYLYSCGDETWLEFDGGVWKPLGAQQQVAAAIELQRELLDGAMRAFRDVPTDDRKRHLNWAVSVQKGKVTDVVFRKASADPRLAIEGPSSFDCDPDLINARNGVIDLRTTRLLPHNPDQRMRKQVRASFRPELGPPRRWLKFLEEITGGDTEYVSYLQRLNGYIFTGHPTEELMFFMFGHGANGKSVLCNVLQHILGDYAVVLSPSFLMMSDHRQSANGPTPEMAKLNGARLALANETESTDTLSAQLVKAAVSTDHIAARPMYGSPVTFAPTHKLVLRGNHKPIIRDTDHGLWRRIHLLPFNQTFQGENVDPMLADALKAEGDQIFTWGVEGARLWYEAGRRLYPCPIVSSYTQAYRTDSDMLGTWLEEECSLDDPSERTEVQKTHEKYAYWCKRMGLSPMTLPALSRRLAERGIDVERKGSDGGKRRYYVGLTVNTVIPKDGGNP